MTPKELRDAARYQDFNLRSFWMSAYRACDEREWAILQARYIDNDTWVTIAEALGLSERQTRRIGNDAMDAALKLMVETQTKDEVVPT